MKLGAITNSWREQLGRQDIGALVGEAQARGARHIELRQTCLGECESGEGDDWRPDVGRLEALVARYPGLSFNLAVAYPCLTQMAQPESGLFEAMLEAAIAVSPSQAHLRMVDPARFGAHWESAGDIPDAAMSIGELVRAAAARGVTLSIENSGQPIRSLALLVGEVRAGLPADVGIRLGLCTDPTNQLRVDPGSDPVGEVEALAVDMIKIAHFKQTLAGEALPALGAGDVDCLWLRDALRGKGYAGAAVMEIPPHARVFDNLAASFAFLEG